MSEGVAQEFLVSNPLLYSDLKKYLWINDTYEEHRNAQKMFDCMLFNKIYVNGFVTQAKSLIGLKMFHKKIFDIKTLSAGTSAVFYESYFGCTDIEAERKGMHKARVINPSIDGDVVIWGAGETGEYAFTILHENKIKVKFFVDSNKSLKGTIKCGLPVYMPDKLEGIEGVTVIEALENWKGLDDSINEKIKKRFHYSLNKTSWNQFTCIDNGVKKCIFDLKQWWSFNFFENKRVYIYGYGAGEYEFAQYLKLMDYDFAGFLVDETDYMDKEDYNEYSVKCVEEILYENNYYIWIYNKKNAKKLKELGLNYFENYINNIYSVDITIERKQVLDVNLGYNYLAYGKYPGIVVYGNDRKEDYKIGILGASTTDGVMYPFKSWPELLHEKIGKENVTIYNCGTGGYTSGQELFKLIRDVLWLEPNMIVVYDGPGEVNICDDHYPFAFNYMRMVFNFANSHMNDSSGFPGNSMSEICLGLESQKNKFENWLSNIRIMHAIALEEGIKFYSFCAPMLSSKEGKSESEKNILLSMPNIHMDKLIDQSFRGYMKQVSELPEYIYDLSHIFDWKNDVYMDALHVWEKGNEIIAEEIKNIILPEIRDKIER